MTRPAISATTSSIPTSSTPSSSALATFTIPKAPHANDTLSIGSSASRENRKIPGQVSSNQAAKSKSGTSYEVLQNLKLFAKLCSEVIRLSDYFERPQPRITSLVSSELSSDPMSGKMKWDFRQESSLGTSNSSKSQSDQLISSNRLDLQTSINSAKMEQASAGQHQMYPHHKYSEGFDDQLEAISRKKPKLFAAYQQFLVAGAEIRDELFRSRLSRRIARSLAYFPAMIKSLVWFDPIANQIDQLLQLTDDWPVTVILPKQKVSFKVLLHGVENCRQMQILLLDALKQEGIEDMGLLPGIEWVNYYKGEGQEPEQSGSKEHGGFYHYRSGTTDTIDLSRPEQSRFWIWSNQSPRNLLTPLKEWQIVLGPSSPALTEESSRIFPGLESTIEICEKVLL